VEILEPHRAGSLAAAARDLSRYEFDLVGMQEVSWDIGGTARKGDYSFFYRRGNNNYHLGTGSFVQHRIISAVKRVEILRSRVSYIL